MLLLTGLRVVCCFAKKGSQPLIMPNPSFLSNQQVKTLLQDIESIPSKPRAEVFFSDIVGGASSSDKYGSGKIFRRFQKRCSSLTKLDIEKYKKLLDEYKITPSERTLAEWNTRILSNFGTNREAFAAYSRPASSGTTTSSIDDVDFEDLAVDDEASEEEEQNIDDFALIGGFTNLSVASEPRVQASKHKLDEGAGAGDIKIHRPPSKVQSTGATSARFHTPPRATSKRAVAFGGDLPSFATPPRFSSFQSPSPEPQGIQLAPPSFVLPDQASVQAPITAVPIMSSSTDSNSGNSGEMTEFPLGSIQNPKIVNISFDYPDSHEVMVFRVPGVVYHKHERTVYIIRMKVEPLDIDKYSARIATGFPGLERRAILIEGPWRDSMDDDVDQFLSRFEDAEFTGDNSKNVSNRLHSTCMKSKLNKACSSKNWLGIFPEGVELDNSVIHPGDNINMTRKTAPMKKQSGRTSFFSVYVYWMVSDSKSVPVGGSSDGGVTDVNSLFASL